MVFAPQRTITTRTTAWCGTDSTEFRDHLVLGYEVLKWESDLPNPTLYHDSANGTERLLAEAIRLIGRDWFDDEVSLA